MGLVSSRDRGDQWSTQCLCEVRGMGNKPELKEASTSVNGGRQRSSRARWAVPTVNGGGQRSSRAGWFPAVRCIYYC